jgi:hypothetical protein
MIFHSLVGYLFEGYPSLLKTCKFEFGIMVNVLQIDPVRTISAGKVNIGAFRTYPKGYKAPDEAQSEYQSIPLSKIEDFGVHCKK